MTNKKYNQRLPTHAPVPGKWLWSARTDSPRHVSARAGSPRAQIPVSGLPACGAPGTVLTRDLRRLGADMFDASTGRIQIKALAKAHVSTWYRSKSVRCKRCPATDRCEGFHINQIRSQGLKLCRPLQPGPATKTESWCFR